MTLSVHSEVPPLHEDGAGGWRVGNSRVLLELVVHAFQDGATPETIVQRYPTLILPDIYAVLAYYLRDVAEVHEYLDEREHHSQQVEKRIKSTQSDLSGIRARIAARRNH